MRNKTWPWSLHLMMGKKRRFKNPATSVPNHHTLLWETNIKGYYRRQQPIYRASLHSLAGPDKFQSQTLPPFLNCFMLCFMELNTEWWMFHCKPTRHSAATALLGLWMIGNIAKVPSTEKRMERRDEYKPFWCLKQNDRLLDLITRWFFFNISPGRNLEIEINMNIIHFNTY